MSNPDERWERDSDVFVVVVVVDVVGEREGVGQVVVGGLVVAGGGDRVWCDGDDDVYDAETCKKLVKLKSFLLIILAYCLVEKNVSYVSF